MKRKHIMTYSRFLGNLSSHKVLIYFNIKMKKSEYPRSLLFREASMINFINIVKTHTGWYVLARLT